MSVSSQGLSARSLATLRVHLDYVATCDRLTQVSGWVCGLDMSKAVGPIGIRVADDLYGAFDLRLRSDLAQAGIAEGYAAFDALLPCSLGLVESAVNVMVIDADGSSGTCSYPAHQIQKFAPQGSIDVIENGLVCGWVVGMPKFTSAEEPALLLDDEPIALLDVHRERKDVPLDDGSGVKRYGFQFDSAHISRVMKARFGSSRSTAKLSLAVNCAVVAVREIKLEAGFVYLGDVLPQGTAPTFSDFYSNCLLV